MKAGQTKYKLSGPFQEILSFFSSFLKLSKVLKVSPPSVYFWIKRGKIPPKHAIRIEEITRGKIKAADII